MKTTKVEIVTEPTELGDYETVAQAAKRWGNVSPITARQLCQRGRVSGAKKIAERWFVPKDAVPTPERYGRPPKWAQSNK